MRNFHSDDQETRCTSPGRPYLIGYNAEKKLAVKRQPNCNQWSCPHCAKEKQREWYLLTARGAKLYLESGSTLRFLTLTARPEKTTSATLLSFAAGWPKLSKRIRREAGTWEYVAVAEMHKSGKMHMHVIGTCSVTSHWLHENAYKCGLGYMAKSIAVGSGNQCGAYVTKYLAKSLTVSAWPANFRRVRRSQGWPPLPAPTLLDGWEWLTLWSEGQADFELAALVNCGYKPLTDS